jgi:hypothetical protein
MDIRSMLYTNVKCLYTYETAHARGGIQLYGSEGYDAMKMFVERYFGDGVMDNKITVEFEDGLFLTYWDGRITIGTSANFFVPVEKVKGTYRVILPIK